MEPVNGRLSEVIDLRLVRADRDELVAALAWIAGQKPALVVRAMNYAQRLADEVDETLLSV
jgi:hypothetical protein